MLMNEYDGFYFLPGEDEHELSLAYFKVKEDEPFGNPVENSAIGDKYHVAFFKRGDDGHPEFEDDFEAIFADPSVYIRNLIGMHIYGCIIRKTECSQEWWQEYLEKAKEYCKLLKLRHVIGSLSRIKNTKEA